MTRAAAFVLALSLGTVAPAWADDAEDVNDHTWHVDGRFDAIVPIATSSYTEVSSFGGGLAGRAYRDWLEVELQLSLYTADGSDKNEELQDRARLLAGYRLVRPGERGRTFIVRGLAGVELSGFDEQSTGWPPENHRLGLAFGVGFESRSSLDWGGVVSLCLSAIVSMQPLGPDNGARYFTGVDLVPGIAIGF